jgi:hypothetical protein
MVTLVMEASQRYRGTVFSKGPITKNSQIEIYNNPATRLLKSLFAGCSKRSRGEARVSFASRVLSFEFNPKPGTRNPKQKILWFFFSSLPG